MANKKERTPMPLADRAKQFMPFAAVKGLTDALAKKEKILVPKRELSDDYRDELDHTLSQIRLGDMVTVVYFHEDEYIRITGLVSRIDRSSGYIQIVNTKISFDDIDSITAAPA